MRGLKAAIARVLACPWQRCTVHFTRDMVMHCRRDQRGLVAAALREIFNAEHYRQAKERVTHVLERLTPVTAKVCELLEQAEEDLIAFYGFPPEHEHSTVRLHRLPAQSVVVRHLDAAAQHRRELAGSFALKLRPGLAGECQQEHPGVRSELGGEGAGEANRDVRLAGARWRDNDLMALAAGNDRLVLGVRTSAHRHPCRTRSRSAGSSRRSRCPAPS